MKIASPVVSILMNCYNGDKYLREAVESVLAQTFNEWELIFWDNQSTDNSAKTIHSFEDPRIRYFLAPMHTDLGGGRAQAWQHLTGEFVAVIDTDDVWLPTKIEEQLKAFESTDVGISITNVEVFSRNRSEIVFSRRPPVGWVTKQLLESYYVTLSSVMVRKSSVDSLDCSFDKQFSHIADFDLIVRLSTLVKLAYVPTVLTRFRIHKDSQTFTNTKRFIDEKKSWIAKHKNNDLFLDYSTDIRKLTRNTTISLAMYYLQTGHYKEAREVAESLGLRSPKALFLYVGSFLPSINFCAASIASIFQPGRWLARRLVKKELNELE